MYLRNDTDPAKQQRRAAVIWLTIILGVVIAILTLMPVSVPNTVPGNDKLHHMLGFFGLTLPCAVIYPRAFLRVAVVAILFGATIEIIQPYVGRTREMADFIADLSGVGLAFLVGWPLNRLLMTFLRQRTSFE